MKQVMQSPSSCDKHLKDMNVKFLTNIKKPENLRKLKDSKSAIVKCGIKSICILGCKIKATFLLKYFLCWPSVGFWALLYLSLNIDVQKIMWGRRVVLFYILYFCYKKKRRKAIINKLHSNNFVRRSLVIIVVYGKITPPIYHSIKSSHVQWPMSQVTTCDQRGVTCSHLWPGSLNMWRFYTVIYCVPKWCHMWQLMCHRSWIEEDGSFTYVLTLLSKYDEMSRIIIKCQMVKTDKI